jgi:hypothetical protein
MLHLWGMGYTSFSFTISQSQKNAMLPLPFCAVWWYNENVKLWEYPFPARPAKN